MADELVTQLADGEELVLERMPTMDSLEDSHERIFEIRRDVFDHDDDRSDHDRP